MPRSGFVLWEVAISVIQSRQVAQNRTYYEFTPDRGYAKNPNNVLKNHGYHLEHNYGHGKHYLAAILVMLNLLAFLFHTILDLTDRQYQLIRQELGTRKTFFQDIQALTRYLYFTSWDALLSFMFQQLELELPPPG